MYNKYGEIGEALEKARIPGSRHIYHEYVWVHERTGETLEALPANADMDKWYRARRVIVRIWGNVERVD